MDMKPDTEKNAGNMSFELNAETWSLLREIGSHMPGGFFIYRAEGEEEILFANRAVFRIFGCGSEEEFRLLTGGTFRGMVHPEDYAAISGSILDQVNGTADHMDHAEYRIVRKDGSVRWVDDYGHYVMTKEHGGIYVVFLSDITEKIFERDTDAATRDAVFATLTNAYNTVWLISDVETEKSSLYHTDLGEEHAEAIRHALSHAKYSDTKTEYVNTMVAGEDRERMQEEIGLPYILEQFEKKDRFSVNFMRLFETGARHYRIDFGRVRMPGGRTGVLLHHPAPAHPLRQSRAVEGAVRRNHGIGVSGVKRAVCDLCKNIISETKFGGRNYPGSAEFSGDTTFALVIEAPRNKVMEFDLCERCASRLASALKRGVLDRADLPELPEEENHG